MEKKPDNIEKKLRHIIYSSDLTKDEYLEISRRFNIFLENGIPNEIFKGRVVATLFFQPSTRTMHMFQSAMIRGGGGWIGTTSSQGLSMEKGETLEETIREYGSFADCIVIRHPKDDSAERAAASSFVPVLNGGSGSREHGVAGAFLVCEFAHYLGRSLEGIKVGIYGTPGINRATKALVPIMGMFGVELIIDDLGEFPLPKEVEKKALKNGAKGIKYDKLDNFISEVDMLIVTRGLQKGIIPEDQFPKEKEEYILSKYRPINLDDMKKLRKDAILYMLKPRIFEIEKDVDADPRAVYAQQEKYVEVAAALMTYILDIEV